MRTNISYTFTLGWFCLMVEGSVEDRTLLQEEDVKEINGFVLVVFNFLEVFTSTFVFVIMLLLLVVRAVGVDGSSMEHTLTHSDKLIVLNYFFSQPNYKDIVVLNGVNIKGCDALIVKRVIAKEGDVVDIKDSSVYVNGVKLNEPYAVGKTLPGNAISYPFKVPKGFIFYLGDNRENSGDARSFGVLPVDKSKGRVIGRFLPLRKFTIF